MSTKDITKNEVVVKGLPIIWDPSIIADCLSGIRRMAIFLMRALQPRINSKPRLITSELPMMKTEFSYCA